MNTFLIKVPGQLPRVRWDETSQSIKANKANPSHKLVHTTTLFSLFGFDPTTSQDCKRNWLGSTEKVKHEEATKKEETKMERRIAATVFFWILQEFLFPLLVHYFNIMYLAVILSICNNCLSVSTGCISVASHTPVIRELPVAPVSFIRCCLHFWGEKTSVCGKASPAAVWDSAYLSAAFVHMHVWWIWCIPFNCWAQIQGHH